MLPKTIREPPAIETVFLYEDKGLDDAKVRNSFASFFSSGVPFLAASFSAASSVGSNSVWGASVVGFSAVGDTASGAGAPLACSDIVLVPLVVLWQG